MVISDVSVTCVHKLRLTDLLGIRGGVSSGGPVVSGERGSVTRSGAVTVACSVVGEDGYLVLQSFRFLEGLGLRELSLGEVGGSKLRGTAGSEGGSSGILEGSCLVVAESVRIFEFYANIRSTSI